MELFYIWIFIMIIATAIDLFTGSFMTIWFAIAAFFALVLNLLGASWILQILVFFISAAGLFFFTKPIAQKSLKKTLVKTNIDAITEKLGEMTKTVTNLEYGEVKVDGKFWTAVSKDQETIEVGEIVDIIGVDGVKLIVKKH